MKKIKILALFLIIGLIISLFVGCIELTTPQIKIGPGSMSNKGMPIDGEEKIVFASDRDGDYDIWMMNPDGTDQEKIIDTGGNDSCPRISPDGLKIAFSSDVSGNDEIYLMNVDSTNLVNLTNNALGDGRPAFSPDGTQIAFMSDRNGKYDIWLMSVSGGTANQVTDLPCVTGSPCFSPDGEKIVFKHRPSNPGNSYTNDLYEIDLTTNQITQLTFMGGSDDYPCFSSDGSQIVFTHCEENWKLNIYIMNSDGSNIRKLTETDSYNDKNSWFSPDDSQIVFRSARDGNCEIYTMDANGDFETNITNNSSDDNDPCWGIIEISDDKPYIDYIEPDSGAPGIEARIIGGNFKAFFFLWVDFGGKIIPAESKSDNEIVVKVPSGKGVVNVKVVSDFQESNPVKFTYKEPFIDWITPSFGLPGEEVTISGKDFGDKDFSPFSHVKFGCSGLGPINPWTDTEIVVKAPLDYGTGKIEKTVLEYLIRIAAYQVGVDIPDPILDKINDLLLKCELEVEPSEGKIELPVRVYTPAGTSNAKVFTCPVSKIIDVILFSPGELRVYDSLERVTGLVNGEVKEEIPYSLCDGSSVVIVSPLDSYRYKVVGTDEGTYKLVVNFVENAETTSFSATDIPETTGAIHQYTIDWETLSQGGEGVTVQIDFDGDGTFELTITTNSTFTFVPAAIDIEPDTLNLKSNIKWVTAYIELPEGYDVTDIDVGTVELWYEVNSVLAEWGDIQDGTLMVKFNGKAVQDLFPGPVDAATVAVTGEVQDGTPFVGNDTIRVIKKP